MEEALRKWGVERFVYLQYTTTSQPGRKAKSRVEEKIENLTYSSLTVTIAYQTSSTSEALVLAGPPSIELIAEERAEYFVFILYSYIS